MYLKLFIIFYLGIQWWRRGYRVRILSHQSRMLSHSLGRSRTSHTHARGSRHSWTAHGSPHGPPLLKGYFLRMPYPLASWALLHHAWWGATYGSKSYSLPKFRLPYARHYKPRLVYFYPIFSVRFIIKSG